MDKKTTALHKIIDAHYSGLTSKGKMLADFVLSNPDKAVFMTTRKLAVAVGVSEATVVRFVRQLNLPGYAVFIKALRNLIDNELTLIERSRLANHVVHSDDAQLERITNQDIENIRAMIKNIDLSEVKRIRKILKKSEAVYIVGSRLSYAPAYYMGWTLSKIRKNVTIFKGSDRTTIDRLIFASQKSAVVIIATSRYPNELIKIGKLVKRYKLKMILLTDSSSCPLVQFSDHVLIAPLKTIPFLGNPASLISLINYLVHTLATDMGEKLKNHQEKLEQAYIENDILFNY
ncbi:MAG: MurR/RpiR family transcriptional regulator [Desulfobacula sp.]|uniref:MurR/RpiR family transcriptional regulator n=1 Tax=Desulfobacula sp. TaxID=2593537 RepID=UPI0025BC5EAD|nr:MurR/RpiR family transcriptional regulator [Desulfobacula sp.]MCD4719115.1 MurR/RpiR family transcriptional regulator [Desulfobacula sp.]